MGYGQLLVQTLSPVGLWVSVSDGEGKLPFQCFLAWANWGTGRHQGLLTGRL